MNVVVLFGLSAFSANRNKNAEVFRIKTVDMLKVFFRNRLAYKRFYNLKVLHENILVQNPHSV